MRSREQTRLSAKTAPRRVAVEPVETDARIPIELDGEPPGHLPAVFEIVPSALRVPI